MAGQLWLWVIQFFRASKIPVDNILSDLAGRHGLATENIHIIRQKRVGASIVSSSVRQGAKTTARLYESAVVLRRT